MRFILFIFISLLFVLLNACTEDSPFVIELEAAEEVYPGNGIVFHSSPSDTTIQLQADSSTIDSVNGEFTLFLSGSYGYEIVELAAEQTLDFTDGQNNNNQISFDVLDFNERGDKISIVFELNGHQLTGLQLVSSQTIIVEEIIVN